MKLVDKNGEDMKKAGEEIAETLGSKEMLKNVEKGNGVKFVDGRKDDSPEAKADQMAVKFEKEKLRRIEEVEADKVKGFDINSLESIQKFEIAYTPVGNSLVVKYVLEELKIGSIWLPDKTSIGFKAIVVVPGLFVNNLLLGDVITIKPNADSRNPMPLSVERVFRGVTFQEISYDNVAGVFKTRKEVIARIAEENKRLKAEEGA